MIPKIIHQIWIGDKNECPKDLMDTWTKKNGSWDHMLWNDENIFQLINQNQFDAYRELPGKADILRYEILHRYGGLFVDADSECIKPLGEEFNANEAFCCYENEIVHPGLLSNGYLGSVKGSRLMKVLIDVISTINPIELKKLPDLSAWQVVGPLLLTQVYNTKRFNLTIYPSHYFIPKHHTGLEYKGNGPVYAKQYWGSTYTREGKRGMEY